MRDRVQLPSAARPPEFVNVGIVWKLPGLDDEEFRRVWADEYAPAVLVSDDVTFYAQVDLELDAAAGARAATYFGVPDDPPVGLALVGFPSSEAAARVGRSAELAAATAELLPTFAERTEAVFCAVLESRAIAASGVVELYASADDGGDGAELALAAIGRGSRRFGALSLRHDPVDGGRPSLRLDCRRRVLRAARP